MNRRAEDLRLRILRGRPRPWLGAGAASLLFHGIGIVGLMQLPDTKPERKTEEKVLQIALVSPGEDSGTESPPAPKTPEPPKEPSPQPPRPAVADAAPAEPTPVEPPIELPKAPTAPSMPAPAPRSFSAWQQSRMAPFVPRNFDFGGRRGTDAVSNEGRDKCAPFPNRHLDRLYLLFDSSGSMSETLRAQAYRCAHQYAREAIDDGATVVVGNFARRASFIAPTTSMTDVAFALRDYNDHTATVLPSTELYRFFDTDPDLTADLVILSDGYIPNYRSVTASYRYFLELNPENRGYLYTLGVQGHPEVTAALRDIGFDIYVYRVF